MCERGPEFDLTIILLQMHGRGTIIRAVYAMGVIHHRFPRVFRSQALGIIRTFLDHPLLVLTLPYHCFVILTHLSGIA